MRLGLGVSVGDMARARPRGMALDSITSAAAFSFRRLRSAYAGPAFSVRRTDGNIQDIGFTADGNLDTATLLGFCHSGVNGFVVTWYDQSGNGRNLTQATTANQPRIVTASALAMTLNGRAGMLLSGSPVTMAATTWGTIAQPFSRNYVMTRRNASVGGRIINSAGGSPAAQEYAPAINTIQLNAGIADGFQTVTNGESVVLTPIYNGASSAMRKNGSSTAPANAGTNGFAGIQLGSFDGVGNFFVCDFYELIVFQSALASADALRLERNQGAYYGITVA
jgi:hypothetical protein